MLINGEKWACEACVRGHRVSNCQHADRPLQHINKKGRPVSQCQHCRAMRKSRASHIKCDCGEKTHKCIHLQTTVDGHKDSCCCNHGGRCTCSHKKEHPQLDTVPESDSEKETTCSQSTKSLKGASRVSRRRANTTHSEGMLAFDENGHHKPTYKHNKAAHKNGPYQLSRVNSLQSASSLGNRSVDDLLQGSKDASSSASPVTSSDGVVQDQRKTRSEAASPLMTGTTSFSQLNGQLPPLDLSAIEYPPYVPNSADFFGNISDHEQPMFSAGLSAASVDWSHYDGLDFGNKATDFAPSNYSQPQSYGGFEYNGSEQLPTLTTTTSTSGEVSEVEDNMMPTRGMDEFETNSGFRNSAASSGFDLNAAQASMLGSTDLSNISYDDFKFLSKAAVADADKFMHASNGPLTTGEDPTLVNGSLGGLTFSSVEDDPAFWMENYAHAHGLPSLTEALTDADPTMAQYWETQ